MKTPACSDVADYVWLTGEEAGAMLVELTDDTTPLHTLVAKLRDRISLERTHLLLEQVELRRRAAAKFAQPERMFFTRIGLEQATDEWIATYKASRFRSQQAGPSLSNGPSRVADLCCGIGGDLLALAKANPVVGIDRDARTAHFATVNSGAQVVTSDAEHFQAGDFDAFHIDPDRRPTGKRTTLLEASEPSLATIESLIAQIPNAAVKLAPATKVPEDWASRCELEWISRDRECRQLVAWHGTLAEFPGQHRATILPAARPAPSLSKGGLAPRTIIGTPNQSVPITERIDRYVFDLDPAVLAAHLKGAVAKEHQLSALSNGPTYLTGRRPINDPALACFEVQDVLPLEPRKLARYLAERSIGRLEIKKRGVDIDPEKLRRELKLRGDNEATLLITPIAERATVILARRTAF